jgi:hypothetical protein
MEATPIQQVICWYVDLDSITKKKVYAGMTDLYGKLPSYREKITDLFDEAEADDMGPAMLQAEFVKLMKGKVIKFNPGAKKYEAPISDNGRDQDPEYTWFLVTDVKKAIDVCIDELNASSHKKEMSYIAEVLRDLRMVEKSEKKTATMNDLPDALKPDSIHISYRPFQHVSETKDYDAVYRFLEFDDEHFEIESEKDVQEANIPGLTIIEDEDEDENEGEESS